MATALVTGASGFIGGHLVEALLRRGDHVRCLVRPNSRIDQLRDLDVELAYADLREPQGLRQVVRGVDTVFHAAGLLRALRVRDLIQTNAEALGHLLTACQSIQTPPLFVLVSSVAAAGPCRRGSLRREGDPPAPVSHYGRSKRAGELIAERYARAVPITVVRPGIVFGPRNRELLPLFWSIRRLRLHLVPTWSPPPLSLVGVEDLVEILLRAASRGERLDPCGAATGERGRGYLFACTGEYPNYLEFGRLVADALGHRHIVFMNLVGPGPWLLGAANQFVSRLRGQPGSFSIDKVREATVGSWACSTAALRRLLDFEPPYRLAHRLRENARWYCDQGWL